MPASAALSRACDTWQTIGYLRRGRADHAFTPSGLAKIFGDDAGVLSRHWLTGLDRLYRLYQRAIRSEESLSQSLRSGLSSK